MPVCLLITGGCCGCVNFCGGWRRPVVSFTPTLRPTWNQAVLATPLRMPYTQKISPLGNIFPEPGTRSVLNGDQETVEPGWEVAYYDDKFLNDWLAQTHNGGACLVAGGYGNSTFSNIRVWFPHTKETLSFPETQIPPVPKPRQVWYADRREGTIKVTDLPGRQLFNEDFEAWDPTADHFPLLHTGHFQNTATATEVFEKFIAPRQNIYSFVPLGTLLPVAAHLQGAYDLPASGQVSLDGFMRCDGAEIPEGNRLQGRVPDLTDRRFLRGATTAGGDGGAESFTLGEENLPEHRHSMNHTHAPSMNAAGAHGHTGSTRSAGSHNHGSSGGVQGIQWRAATPGGKYLNHGTYPSSGHTVTYEYRDGGQSGGGWEYVRTSTTEGTPRRVWVGGDDTGRYETHRTPSRQTRHYRRATIRSLPARYQPTGGSLSVSSAGSHTHPVTVNSGGSHTHAIDPLVHRGQTGAKGRGAAKVHLPKYFDAVYLIKVN